MEEVTFYEGDDTKKPKLFKIEKQNFLSLPKDLIINIFNFLRVKELFNLRILCKYIYLLIKNSMLWKTRLNNNTKFIKFALMVDPLEEIPTASIMQYKSDKIIQNSQKIDDVLKYIEKLMDITFLSGYYGICFKVLKKFGKYTIEDVSNSSLIVKNCYVVKKNEMVLELKKINNINNLINNNYKFDIIKFFKFCYNLYEQHSDILFKIVTKKMEDLNYKFILNISDSTLLFYIYWGKSKYHILDMYSDSD
jgi:hypothetical protein